MEYLVCCYCVVNIYEIAVWWFHFPISMRNRHLNHQHREPSWDRFDKWSLIFVSTHALLRVEVIMWSMWLYILSDPLDSSVLNQFNGPVFAISMLQRSLEQLKHFETFRTIVQLMIFGSIGGSRRITGVWLEVLAVICWKC